MVLLLGSSGVVVASAHSLLQRRCRPGSAADIYVAGHSLSS